MHGRKYRNAARDLRRRSSPTRRSPPTTSPRRSASRASGSSSRIPGSAPSSRADGDGGRPRRPVPAHGRDARAAQEPRHARRRVRAARRHRARARRRRRRGLGRAAASSTGPASSGSAASPTRSSRASTAAPPRSSTRRASRASGCRSPRRWPPARRSSPRRTRRWTRPAGDAAVRADPESPEAIAAAIREALARRDELRALGPRARRRLLVARGPASSSSRGTGDSRRHRHDAAPPDARRHRALRARAARPPRRARVARCRSRRPRGCARSPPTRSGTRACAPTGVDVLHCPTFRGPFSLARCRSS